MIRRSFGIGTVGRLHMCLRVVPEGGHMHRVACRYFGLSLSFVQVVACSAGVALFSTFCIYETSTIFTPECTSDLSIR